MKVDAIDAAALRPFEKEVHSHGRENEKSLLYSCCDFSVRYSFGKIIKTVATRRHILKRKCTKFHFGSAPDQAFYSPPPDFRGPTSKGKERSETEG